MENLASRTQYSIDAENARFMSRVYAWMAAGICLSGGVSWEISQSEAMMQSLVTNRLLFAGLIVLQLAAVLSLSYFVQRLNAVFAALIYLGYAALTGATLSVIFLVYTQESILQVFGMTAFAFAGLSTFGLVTRRDLGPVGSFCTMGLFGMIGYGLLALFFPGMMSGVSSQVYGVVGLIVFSGLTAYDTQKIKALNILGNEGTDEDRKEAIFGALTLYLDFINLFLSLLRLMGRRR
jgi:FtsH-binding integral membrane protein